MSTSTSTNSIPTTTTITAAPLELPTPPLTYYPPPPQEPIWRDQRQRHHVSSLHDYIGDLFVWTELCRNQLLFVKQRMGLPVAKQELWETFLQQCLSYIQEWIDTLRQWTSGDGEMVDGGGGDPGME